MDYYEQEEETEIRAKKYDPILKFSYTNPHKIVTPCSSRTAVRRASGETRASANRSTSAMSNYSNTRSILKTPSNYRNEYAEDDGAYASYDYVDDYYNEPHYEVPSSNKRAVNSQQPRTAPSNMILFSEKTYEEREEERRHRMLGNGGFPVYEYFAKSEGLRHDAVSPTDTHTRNNYSTWLLNEINKDSKCGQQNGKRSHQRSFSSCSTDSSRQALTAARQESRTSVNRANTLQNTSGHRLDYIAREYSEADARSDSPFEFRSRRAKFESTDSDARSSQAYGVQTAQTNHQDQSSTSSHNVRQSQSSHQQLVGNSRNSSYTASNTSNYPSSRQESSARTYSSNTTGNNYDNCADYYIDSKIGYIEKRNQDIKEPIYDYPKSATNVNQTLQNSTISSEIRGSSTTSQQSSRNMQTSGNYSVSTQHRAQSQPVETRKIQQTVHESSYLSSANRNNSGKSSNISASVGSAQEAQGYSWTTERSFSTGNQQREVNSNSRSSTSNVASSTSALNRHDSGRRSRRELFEEAYQSRANSNAASRQETTTTNMKRSQSFDVDVGGRTRSYDRRVIDLISLYEELAELNMTYDQYMWLQHSQKQSDNVTKTSSMSDVRYGQRSQALRTNAESASMSSSHRSASCHQINKDRNTDVAGAYDLQTRKEFDAEASSTQSTGTSGRYNQISHSGDFAAAQQLRNDQTRFSNMAASSYKTVSQGSTSQVSRQTSEPPFFSATQRTATVQDNPTYETGVSSSRLQTTGFSSSNSMQRNETTHKSQYSHNPQQSAFEKYEASKSVITGSVQPTRSAAIHESSQVSQRNYSGGTSEKYIQSGNSESTSTTNYNQRDSSMQPNDGNYFVTSTVTTSRLNPQYDTAETQESGSGVRSQSSINALEQSSASENQTNLASSATSLSQTNIHGSTGYLAPRYGQTSDDIRNQWLQNRRYRSQSVDPMKMSGRTSANYYSEKFRVMSPTPAPHFVRMMDDAKKQKDGYEVNSNQKLLNIFFDRLVEQHHYPSNTSLNTKRAIVEQSRFMRESPANFTDKFRSSENLASSRATHSSVENRTSTESQFSRAKQISTPNLREGTSYSSTGSMVRESTVPDARNYSKSVSTGIQSSSTQASTVSNDNYYKIQPSYNGLQSNSNVSHQQYQSSSNRYASEVSAPPPQPYNQTTVNSYQTRSNQVEQTRSGSISSQTTRRHIEEAPARPSQSYQNTKVESDRNQVSYDRLKHARSSPCLSPLPYQGQRQMSYSTVRKDIYEQPQYSAYSHSKTVSSGRSTPLERTMTNQRYSSQDCQTSSQRTSDSGFPPTESYDGSSFNVVKESRNVSDYTSSKATGNQLYSARYQESQDADIARRGNYMTTQNQYSSDQQSFTPSNPVNRNLLSPGMRSCRSDGASSLQYFQSRTLSPASSMFTEDRAFSPRVMSPSQFNAVVNVQTLTKTAPSPVAHKEVQKEANVLRFVSGNTDGMSDIELRKRMYFKCLEADNTYPVRVQLDAPEPEPLRMLQQTRRM